jgi:hypothetical protein
MVPLGVPDREPTETTNLTDAEPIPWSRPRDLLDDATARIGTAFFLGTVRPDGRPHSAAFGAAWHEGDLYFQTGHGSRKARNLAANPACTISVSLPGIDLIVEGEAQRVTDVATLEAVAAVYRERGWPAEVEGDGLTAPFNAPGTGPPPWPLYRVTARTAFGVATAEPYGASRWRF